jgi:hypothetical protein
VDGAREPEWSCSKKGCSQDFWNELHIDFSLLLAGALHSASMFQKRGNAANMDHVPSIVFGKRSTSGISVRENWHYCRSLTAIIDSDQNRESLGRSRIESRRNVAQCERPGTFDDYRSAHRVGLMIQFNSSAGAADISWRWRLRGFVA